MSIESRECLVSVVIPTYNNSTLVLATLDSVFAQTFLDYEVVVVNDGSTDDTAEKLAPLAATGRIRLITQENGGVGNARNRGIHEAKGKYVALLDHDDLWLPRKLEEQVAYAERHPECSVITVPWAQSTTPTQRIFSEDLLDAEGHIERPLSHMAEGLTLICSSSMFFEKKKAEGLYFGTKPRCTEDVQFQIGILARGALGCAGKEILMIYSKHESNYSSQSVWWSNGLRWLRELDRSGYFREVTGLARADLSAYLAHFGRTAMARLLLAGQRWKAAGLYVEELPFQWRKGRWKFLLSFPLLLAAPLSVIQRVI